MAANNRGLYTRLASGSGAQIITAGWAHARWLKCICIIQTVYTTGFSIIFGCFVEKIF